MNANKQVKTLVVKDIAKHVADSHSLVIAEYHGLTVAQIEALRQLLKENNVVFKVYKNRLFKLALKETAYSSLADSLIGPNAFVFGLDENISPAKILYNFAKENEALKLKSGIYEGQVIGLEELLEVAKLPTMQEALTKLALALMTPLSDLARGLKMYTEENKGESNE